ncbi:Aldo/keto reductase [Polychaeton citri CBS 116435]|uniref:Aldo/keto reductase n=1 Tax=Polychaeton citri CBS 116435 TaxID=1314669 RepID=A0A9P4Q7B5_9PEZI|nr:Aldo/keto reductase [Polychaeton citri CBS 116435]
MAAVKIVYGAACIKDDFQDVETLTKVFDVLEKYNVKAIDTAFMYGESETFLGEANASKRFIIDTKQRGGLNKADRENVLAEAKSSQEKLKSTVDVFYLHAPDYNTPFEETLEAVNEVYKSGFFKRFGLSNFKAQDVQKLFDIAKEKGYVLPTVYQGNYNAVARLQEEQLFPTLRKLGISFYAYSPMAGGFFAKTKQYILDGKGRFDTSTFIGKLYSKLYNRPSYLEALDTWDDIAKEEGVTKTNLAYRWVRYNSILKPEHGDAIIIGGSTIEQIEQTLGAINEGPLSEKAAKRIDDEVWATIKNDAAVDMFHDAVLESA